MWGRGIVMAGLCAATAGCEPGDVDEMESPDMFAPQYFGVETRLLDNELVNFEVSMANGTSEMVEDYAECAAAQYTLIRGYGFTRHVRTLVDERGGIWSADAVYTVSPALPQG